jgi:hypothetical protein
MSKEQYFDMAKKEVQKAVLSRLGVENKGPCGICSRDVTGSRRDRVKDDKGAYYHEKCWDRKHPGR